MVANFFDLGDSGYGNEFGFVSSNLEVDLDVVVRVLWALTSFFFLVEITMAFGYGWL